MKMKHLLFCLFLSIMLIGCAKEKDEISTINESCNLTTEMAKEEFAKILSIAVYNNQSLREFLKAEALKQFDRDYDILYLSVKNKPVTENESLRDILIKYSETPEKLLQIEEQLPLLTIYIPDWEWITGVGVNNWDTKSNIVAVSAGIDRYSHELWGNGEIIATLGPTDFPPFITLIVKDNERVRIKQTTKAAEDKEFEFIDPCFDGATMGKQTKGDYKPTDDTNVQTLTVNNYVLQSELNHDLITAYNTCKGKNQLVQRDYLYYGMTDDNQQHGYQRRVSEKIYKIRFNSSGTAAIYDQTESSSSAWIDPQLRTDEEESLNRRLTSEELIAKFWVDGNLELVFNVYLMDKNGNIVSIRSFPRTVAFMDMFYLTKVHAENRHETWFNWYTDYKYYVHTDCYAPKWYVLDEELIYEWNIGENSANIKIVVEEKDSDETVTRNMSFKGVFATNFKEYQEASIALSGHISDYASISGTLKTGGEYGGSQTIDNTSSIQITTTHNSDILGEGILYYNKPIIASLRRNAGHDEYYINTVSTGSMQLMIIPELL